MTDMYEHYDEDLELLRHIERTEELQMADEEAARAAYEAEHYFDVPDTAADDIDDAPGDVW